MSGISMRFFSPNTYFRLPTVEEFVKLAPPPTEGLGQLGSFQYFPKMWRALSGRANYDRIRAYVNAEMEAWMNAHNLTESQRRMCKVVEMDAASTYDPDCFYAVICWTYKPTPDCCLFCDAPLIATER